MVLHTCETWVKHCCQECSPYVTTTMIFNMPFYHKMWEHNTHQDKNVGVFKFAPTQICVHMNSYGNGVKYHGSLDVGSQNPATSEWGWHTHLQPISKLYSPPHLVNNEHPLTYHSLFNSITHLVFDSVQVNMLKV